jgi:cellobiose-specific phosphotransferase system component IIA
VLTTNLVLDDASGDDVTYNQITSKVVGEILRIVPTEPLSEPQSLAIRHTVQGKGASAANRHNVLFSKTIKDASGVSSTGQVSLTLVHPVQGAVTAQILIDLVANLVDLLTAGAITGISDTANIAGLLRGEA